MEGKLQQLLNTLAYFWYVLPHCLLGCAVGCGVHAGDVSSLGIKQGASGWP